MRFGIDQARYGQVISGLPILLIAFGLAWCTQGHADRGDEPTVKLPTAKRTGRVSLEEALARRRSVRDFAGTALSDAELSQLLWAAQGITQRSLGLRTAPSAGALYPLEVFLSTQAGVFQYEPETHQLHQLNSTDVRNALFKAALRQESVRDAPAVFAIVGVYERTAKKYGSTRARRYVHIEAGHAAQNLLLQAVTMDLAAVPIGAFEDDKVKRVLALPRTHEPLYLVPVGHPAR